MYGYKRKYSEGSLTTYCLAKQYRFLPRTCDIPSHGLLTRFTVPSLNKFWWKRPQLESEAVDKSPLSMCHYYLIIIIIISCQRLHLAWQVGTVAFRIGWKNATDVFLPGSLLSTSWTLKASQQEGSFQVSCSLLSLCPASVVCFPQ
jgi:hypothetical protein